MPPASLPPSRPLITLTGTLQTDLAQRVYRKYGERTRFARR